MLRRIAAAVVLLLVCTPCTAPLTASARAWPAEDPTTGADGDQVWGRHADNDDAEPSKSDRKTGRGGGASKHRATPPWWEQKPPKGCLRTATGYFCPKPDKKKATTPDPVTAAREVIAKLKLPNPTPRFGPDPSVNEWNMLAVGFPIWLWTDQPTHLTTTAHHDGLTFHLTATWQNTTFTMGDGHTTTCTTTTTYPTHINKPGTPSPTCGYTYNTPSPKNHPYTVTAQTNWQITWTTAGQTGTLPHTYTGHRTLTIGELASLVNG
jgi:hypothetical protein